MREVVERAIELVKEGAGICENHGILSISERGVHLSDRDFHKLYDQYTVKPYTEGYFYHGFEKNGIEVFCLVRL